MHAIPRSRSSAIPRHRLLALLSDWPRRRLISIIAPAGYGKTMLAADWIRSLADLPPAQQPAVAWLSLHESLDAERCLHSLAQELLPFIPALQAILSLDGSGHYSPAQRLRLLCAELAAAAQPVVLVIDDFQLITDPDALALFQQLLDSAPDHLHLVLVSRNSPSLRVDRLILEDALLTLNQHDLAVQHDEFLQLVPLLGLASQPAAALDELERRCSGWIAGLKLLAHDALRSGKPVHPPPGLSGSALFQFIESRILASLSEPLRAFTRQAAQLPWMSAELLAAVTDAPPAECRRMLAELVASNAFVVEFDAPNDGTHFRFHPLVQEALRTTADAAASDDLRRRAAAWFLQREDADAALYVLGPTPFPPELAPDLARAIRRALLRFDLAAARRWLAAPPAALLDSHASLAVCAAWTEFLAESAPPFVAALLHAQAVLLRCPPTSDLDELRRDVAVLAVYRHLLDNNAESAARELAIAESIPAATNSLGGGYLFLMRSLSQRDTDTHEVCIHLLQQAAAVFERIGHDYGVVAMLITSMTFKLRHADMHGALATSIFLQGFTRTHSLVHIPHARENLLLQGRFLYLLDRIPEAREILHEFLRQSVYDDAKLDDRYIARVHLQLCDAADAADPAAVLRAIDAVEDAAHWAQILKLEWDISKSLAAWPRIVREHRAGRPESCRQTAESMRLSLAALDDQTPATVRLAVLAGAALGGDDSPALAAHLQQFLAHVEAMQMPFIAIQVRLLQVIYAHRRADMRDVTKILRALLPDIERSGARRLLLDFPELHSLARRCSPEHAARLLPQDAAPTSRTIKPSVRLTRQELRILDQMAGNMSTREIAAAHTLSEKTVYGHIQNIYKKLGVHSREEAVRVWKLIFPPQTPRG